ncbi:MAG: hypothetical protein V1809_04275 [Planctomycetota bacterium]
MKEVPDLLDRSLRMSLALGALGALFVARAEGFVPAAAFLIGVLWNAANVTLLQRVGHAILNKASWRRVCGWAVAKLALYGAGVMVIMGFRGQIAALVAGISLIPAVILLKALGRIVAERYGARGAAS